MRPLPSQVRPSGRPMIRLPAGDIEIDAQKDRAGGKRHHNRMKAKASRQNAVEEAAQHADPQSPDDGDGGREAKVFPQLGRYHRRQAGYRPLRQIERSRYDHERLAHRHDRRDRNLPENGGQVEGRPKDRRNRVHDHKEDHQGQKYAGLAVRHQLSNALARLLLAGCGRLGSRHLDPPPDPALLWSTQTRSTQT